MHAPRSTVWILFVLTVTACGTSSRLAPVDDIGTADRAESVPAPGSSAPASVPEAHTRPLPESGAAAPSGHTGGTPLQGRAANPAIVALLNDANRASASGQHARAASSVERALTIEPQNAWLWHRLALIRLAQNNLGQAAALAAKSNSLAGDDRRLQADNWRLIAEVHQRRGEHTAARSAKEKASRLAGP